MNDVAANTIGAAVGITALIVLQLTMTSAVRLRTTWNDAEQVQTSTRARESSH